MKIIRWVLFISFIHIFSYAFPIYSQIDGKEWTKKWSVEAKGGYGYVIPCDQYYKPINLLYILYR